MVYSDRRRYRVGVESVPAAPPKGGDAAAEEITTEKDSYAGTSSQSVVFRKVANFADGDAPAVSEAEASTARRPDNEVLLLTAESIVEPVIAPTFDDAVDTSQMHRSRKIMPSPMLLSALCVLQHLLLPLGILSQPQGDTPRRPNLLFILTDQQTFDAFGLAQEDFGVPERSRVQTPNMDRIAKEGAYFRNAYTHCAVCTPARVSLLTGCTIETHGVRNNWVGKANWKDEPGIDAASKIPSLRTYDQILGEDFGYAAEYYGKWHAPYSQGCVYDNEVRAAGTTRASFCSYDSSGKEVMTEGMSRNYWEWLTDRGIPEVTRPDQLPSGQQQCSFTRRAYKTDALDPSHGKQPGSKTSSSNRHGLDLVGDGNSISAHQGNDALDALDRLGKSDNPFTLHVSFHAPHNPFVATERYHKMYDTDNLDPPPNLNDDMTNSAYRGRSAEKGSAYRDLEKLRRWKATYYGTVTEIDEWVGRLTAKLETLGIDDDTMVIFTSDHGEMLGAHGMRGKTAFYDESARVPLAMRFPGRIQPGIIVEEPVTHIDMHASILDYLGVVTESEDDWPTAYKSDGKSLRSTIDGCSTSDNFVVTMWNSTDIRSGSKASSQPAFMVRKGMWKLMVPNPEGKSNNAIEMLFDLEADPHEMNNLVGKNGMTARNDVIGKAEHLKALLGQHLILTGHPVASQEIRRRGKWSSLNFWVGDTVVNFRTLLPDRTRTEWLYMGRSVDNDAVVTVDISIDGVYADRYHLDWTKAKIAASAYKRVAITYAAPPVTSNSNGTECLTSPHTTMLVIAQHNAKGNIEERRVKLMGPGQCKMGSPATVSASTTLVPVTSAPASSNEVEAATGSISTTLVPVTPVTSTNTVAETATRTTEQATTTTTQSRGKQYRYPNSCTEKRGQGRSCSSSSQCCSNQCIQETLGKKKKRRICAHTGYESGDCGVKGTTCGQHSDCCTTCQKFHENRPYNKCRG